jgi:hypothetical protein
MRNVIKYKLILFILVILISLTTFFMERHYSSAKELPLADMGTTYVKAVYSLPVTLDPIEMNDTASLLFSELAYDGLVRFRELKFIE